MLVLGDEARTNGLGKSLLHGLYNDILDTSEENPYSGNMFSFRIKCISCLFSSTADQLSLS